MAIFNRWGVATALAGAVGVVVAGQTDSIKFDPRESAACLEKLINGDFSPETDALQIVSLNKGAIAAASVKYDLPPELLAAVIYDHQIDETPRSRFSDCFFSSLGSNLSIGAAQVRISTAAKTDGRYQITPIQFKEYRANLLDPELNVQYEAKEFRQLLERRYPGITADELINNPHAMAIAITEYRTGPKNAANEITINSYAYRALVSIIQERGLHIFGRGQSFTAEIQEQIKGYLAEIKTFQQKG